MKYPKLIILYGRFQTTTNWKQQRMIDGGATCMYREMAQTFGEIIYLAPQKISKKWEKCFISKKTLIDYLKSFPDAVIWSVKHDLNKDSVLNLIPNKKVYYSCCSYDMYNSKCDISLVDLPSRIKNNGKLWVKGKNPTYWKPSNNKIYDLLIMGSRGDKNELFFLKNMQQTDKEYSILWIGGDKFRDKQINKKHQVCYTPFFSMEDVRKHIPLAKMGVILSEHPAEGFPQSFLEMTMCGVPVVYLFKGSPNRVYSGNFTGIVDKHIVSAVVEDKLSTWTMERSESVREYAKNNYSLEKSYESILFGLE